MFRNENPPALVVVTTPSAHSLWDPEVSLLLERLDDALDGVFVTHASSTESGPSVKDALAAARFFGCQRAVVVETGETTAGNDIGSAEGVTYARSPKNIGGILSAYLASRYLDAVEGAAA
jgi:hypothetical protein